VCDGEGKRKTERGGRRRERWALDGGGGSISLEMVSNESATKLSV